MTLATIDAADPAELPALPSRKDEAWRYTAVAELLERLATATPSPRAPSLDASRIDLMAGDHGGPRLVFVNGTFDAGSSRPATDGDVTVAPISSGVVPAPDVTAIDGERLDGFAARSWANGADGAAVRVRAGATAAAPVHIVNVAVPGPDGPLATNPNAVITVEPGARVTVIESFVGTAGDALTNASTIIEVGKCATLAYHRVQAEAADAAHVGRAQIRAGEGAVVRATSFSLGANVSRVALDIAAGDHATIDVDGLYLPSGDDQHDNVVTVDHLGSHARSTQRFKGVIDDRARGSFTGHVIVRPGTVDTSATQANHSLLLARSAESDARPWLEILADDVSCTHGASVGRLDDDALFYLRSRGIPQAEARRMLIEGFVGEIVDSVEPPSLRDHLVARIAAEHDRARQAR